MGSIVTFAATQTPHWLKPFVAITGFVVIRLIYRFMEEMDANMGTSGLAYVIHITAMVMKGLGRHARSVKIIGVRVNTTSTSGTLFPDLRINNTKVG